MAEERRRSTANFRNEAVLNKLLRHGSFIGDIDEELLENTDSESIHEMHSQDIFAKLAPNNNAVDFFCFDESVLKHTVFADLLRTLAKNNSLKHVWVTCDFLDPLDPIKARLVLDIVGRLPLLEKLSIQFPDKMGSCVVSLLISAIRSGTKLKSIQVSGLRLGEYTDGDELGEKFALLQSLESLELFDFVNYDVDVDNFLEAVGRLPQLKSFEIRMKHEESELEGMYLQYLANSSSIESLTLWKLRLDCVQVTHLCECLASNTTLKCLELWRCDLGPTFGISLGDAMEKNSSLARLLIADVEFHGSGVVSLMRALRTNNSLQYLGLLGIGSVREERVIKSSIHLLKENEILRTVQFHDGHMDNDECLEFYKIRKKVIKTEKTERQRKIDYANKNICQKVCS